MSDASDGEPPSPSLRKRRRRTRSRLARLPKPRSRRQCFFDQSSNQLDSRPVKSAPPKKKSRAVSLSVPVWSACPWRRCPAGGW